MQRYYWGAQRHRAIYFGCDSLSSQFRTGHCRGLQTTRDILSTVTLSAGSNLKKRLRVLAGDCWPALHWKICWKDCRRLRYSDDLERERRVPSGPCPSKTWSFSTRSSSCPAEAHCFFPQKVEDDIRRHWVHVQSKGLSFNPFTPKFKTYILPTFYREMYEWCSENWWLIIFHLSKLWKAKFFIMCDVIFRGKAAGEIWHWSLLGGKVLTRDYQAA